MKKLIFSTLLFLGMLGATQAQFQLDYHLENFSTTSTWTFTLSEAGGQSINPTIGPGGSITATFPNDAFFPISWTVTNGAGCTASGVDITNVPDTNVTAPCPTILTPPGTGVYKIEQLSLSPLQNIFKMGMK